MSNNCYTCKYAKIMLGSSVPYGIGSIHLPDDIDECTNKQVSELNIDDYEEMVDLGLNGKCPFFNDKQSDENLINNNSNKNNIKKKSNFLDTWINIIQAGGNTHG